MIACVDVLHAQTVARTPAKRNVVIVHGGIDFSKPAFGDELEGFRVYSRVGMHEVGGHADRDLRKQ